MKHGVSLKHPLVTAQNDHRVRSSVKLVYVVLVTGEFVSLCDSGGLQCVIV